MRLLQEPQKIGFFLVFLVFLVLVFLVFLVLVFLVFWFWYFGFLVRLPGHEATTTHF